MCKRPGLRGCLEFLKHRSDLDSPWIKILLWLPSAHWMRSKLLGLASIHSFIPYTFPEQLCAQPCAGW